MRTSTFLLGACLAVLATGCQAGAEQRLLGLHLGVVPEAAPGVVAGVQGQLRVELNSLTPRASRSLLSTVADIHHVTIKLTGPGAATATQTLTAAQIAAGQTSFVFPALALGSWTYEVQAYDAASANIGYATGTAMVTGGHVTTVPITLQLAPTLLPAATSGGLTANLSLTDGLSATGIVAIGSYSFLSTTNKPWTSAKPFGTTHGILFNDVAGIKQLDATAQLVDQWPYPSGTTSYLAVATDGAVWTANATTVVRYPQGSKVGTSFPFVVGALNFSPDQTGGMWMSNAQGPVHLSSTGSVIGSATMGLVSNAPSEEQQLRIAVDASSSAYFVTNAGAGAPSQITRLSTTGNVLNVLSGPELKEPRQLRVDASNNLWALNTLRDAGDGRYHLLKYASDGTLLGSFATESLANPASTGDYAPKSFALDPAGNAWICYPHSTYISELSASGQRLGLYSLTDAAFGLDVWFDPAGTLWVERVNTNAVMAYAAYQP